MAGMVSLEKCRRYTLDAKKVREVAAGDPYGFVKHVAGETLVIDEIQKVPELLDAIKIVVDRDNSKGQYLLTGSSNLHFAKTVKDSLAGRLGRIRLRPLSYGEINGKAPSFLACAFAREFKSEYADIDKRGIIVVPDFLANSGGVIGSYFEWVQDLAGFFWTEEEYNNRLVPIMKDNFKRVWDYSQEHNVKMRRAAFLVAIKRVADGLKLKGFFL